MLCEIADQDSQPRRFVFYPCSTSVEVRTHAASVVFLATDAIETIHTSEVVNRNPVMPVGTGCATHFATALDGWRIAGAVEIPLALLAGKVGTLRSKVAVKRGG